MCENLILTDRRNLDSYIELNDEILYYYSDRSGYTFAATGRYELQQKWFPYSRVYYAPGRPTGAKEEATTALLNYLLQNNLIGVEITPEQVDFVIQEIGRIITIYGRHELGFDRGNPQSLGPALRRFNMECTDTSHHNRNKIITLKRCP